MTGRAPMRTVTRTGLVLIPDLSDEQASVVGRHDNAVKRYLDTGDDSALTQFKGVTVAGHELETDLDALDWLALAAAIDFLEIYEEI